MGRVLILGSYAPSLVTFRGPFLRALKSAGWEVHTAAPKIESVAPQLESWGMSCHSVAIERQGMNPIAEMRTLYSVMKLLRHVNPDTLIAYTIKPVVWGMVAAKLMGIPNRIAMVTGVGVAFTETGGRSTGSKMAIARSLYALGLRLSHGVLFQNEQDAELLRQHGVGHRGQFTAVVRGSGVDTEELVPNELPMGPTVFLMIARVLGNKGVREFIEAASVANGKHLGGRFILAGPLDDGPDAISRAELERMCQTSPVQWVGRVDDVPGWIGKAHVVVLPSYREGTPRSVLEGMSMGRAIITTRVPGCEQTVEHEKSGILVRPRDVTDLADAMGRLLEKQDQIPKMGIIGRRRAEAMFSCSIVIPEMVTFVTKVRQRGKRGDKAAARSD